MTGAVIEADRHIEITGPEEVTSFQFSEDKGNTWQPIDKFEGNIKITTTTEHKVRAAFHEEGDYTIRLWMTDDEGVVVKESVKKYMCVRRGDLCQTKCACGVERNRKQTGISMAV